MRRVITVFLNELKYSFIILNRYRMNWMFGLLNLFLSVLFLNLGIKSFGNYVAENVLDLKLTQMIIGLFVFIVIAEGLNNIISKITQAKQSGVLEQIIVNPLGSKYIFVIKFFADFVIVFISIAIIIPITMIITSKIISFNMYKLIILIIPLLFCTLGVGLILGGATLVFKKLQSATHLMQFLILTLMVVPSYPINAYSLLPIAVESMTINKVFSSQIYLSFELLAFLYAHSFSYFILGLLVYSKFEDYAKTKGILGHY